MDAPTILISNVLIQVDLGIDPVAIDSLQAAAEDVTVLEAEVLGGGEEVAGHFVREETI